MSKTYWRIHPRSEDPADLLEESRWTSRAWIGSYERRCATCHGGGRVWDDDGDYACTACRGQGHVEDVRRGVSVCSSLEDLRDYLADREWTRDCVVVELRGEVSDDEDHEQGALLVLPSEIVAVHPLTVLD